MDCKATSRSRKHKASNLQCFRPDQQYSGSMPKSHGDTLTHLFGDIVPVETHYCETVGLGHRVRLVAAIENGGHVVGPLDAQRNAVFALGKGVAVTHPTIRAAI